MNEFQIGTEPADGGYTAWIRRVHRARRDTILGEGGAPVLYPTRDAAMAAAGEAIVAYMNGHILRDGVKATVHAAADALFPTLVRQYGREGGIPVKRRGQR